MLKENCPDGVDYKVIRTADKRIEYCTACESCAVKKGSCVIKDDMPEIIREIILCDRLLFLTPVYFSGAPASLKALIDRTQVLYNAPELTKNLPAKKAYLLGVGGSREYADQFTGLTSSLKYLLRIINAKMTEKLFFPDTDALKGDFSESQKDALRDFISKIFEE